MKARRLVVPLDSLIARIAKAAQISHSKLAVIAGLTREELEEMARVPGRELIGQEEPMWALISEYVDERIALFMSIRQEIAAKQRKDIIRKIKRRIEIEIR